MLDPGQWQELRGLLWVARRLVEGAYAGRHASPLPGRGIEFHDYRPYTGGEDLGQIDWKLFGRTDRYFLRVSRQLTDCSVLLVVDHSASMDFASVAPAAAGQAGRRSSSGAAHEALAYRLGRWLGQQQQGRRWPGQAAGLTVGQSPGHGGAGRLGPSKLAYAAMLAAAIAFLTIRQGDRAALALAATTLSAYLPPRGAWAHLQQICQKLEQTRCAAGPGDLAAALRQLHVLRAGGAQGLIRRRSGRGLLVVISDLLDEPGPLLDSLARFRHQQYEVIVFQVLTPAEMDLSLWGGAALTLCEPERGLRLPADLAQARAGYQRELSGHIDALHRGCVALGAQHNLLSTHEPIGQALRR